MYYPESFKAKCLSIYPTWSALHSRLETGDVFVGRYLDDAQQGSLSVDTILSATSLEALQREARYVKQKKELYAEWWDLYEQQGNK